MKIPTLLLLSFLTLSACFEKNATHSMKEKTSTPGKDSFDWQGHRGTRGLLPENTIPAFIKAVELGVNTLELDIAISKDRIPIVSHDPWMSPEICSKPDGTPVTEEEAKDLKIYGMTYAEIKQYDCGSRGNPHFEEQQAMKVHKPSLRDMVTAVEAYCKKNQLPVPFYNIEIKSRPEWDDVFAPKPDVFASLLLAEMTSLGINDRANIQSFDPRSLHVVKKAAPGMPLALLVENEDGVDANLARLGFVPQIYSPYFPLLDKKAVEKLHAKGMKVIPWTVDETDKMEQLIDMGVDGIITDYPNRIPRSDK